MREAPVSDTSERSRSEGGDAKSSVREYLRVPLREYFELPARETLPRKLAELIAAFDAVLGTRGDAVSAEFHDGLMRALPALRTFALSLCGDASRADDLVQETMLKAWANHHRFEPGTRLIAWLFTILRNLFYSEARKRKREVEDADGVYAEALTALPDQEDSVALKGLYAILENLPASQRDALLLVGAEGFTYEEAARILDCRVGTVKSRVSRARAQVTELFEAVEKPALASV